jgi:hypothetical protein
LILPDEFFGRLGSRHEFEAELRSLAFEVGHVAAGALALIIGGAAVDVFYAMAKRKMSTFERLQSGKMNANPGWQPAFSRLSSPAHLLVFAARDASEGIVCRSWERAVLT